MGTLSSCIRKAGKALDKSDSDAIKLLRDDLKADGLAAQEAAVEAVKAHMTALMAERGTMTEGLKAAPAVPSLPNFQPVDDHVSPPFVEADYTDLEDFAGDGWRVRVGRVKGDDVQSKKGEPAQEGQWVAAVQYTDRKGGESHTGNVFGDSRENAVMTALHRSYHPPRVTAYVQPAAPGSLDNVMDQIAQAAVDQDIVAALEQDDDVAIAEHAEWIHKAYGSDKIPAMLASKINRLMADYGIPVHKISLAINGLTDDTDVYVALLKLQKEEGQANEPASEPAGDTETSGKSTKPRKPAKYTVELADGRIVRRREKKPWVTKSTAHQTLRELGLQETHRVEGYGNEGPHGREYWIEPKYSGYQFEYSQDEYFNAKDPKTRDFPYVIEPAWEGMTESQRSNVEYDIRTNKHHWGYRFTKAEGVMRFGTTADRQAFIDNALNKPRDERYAKHKQSILADQVQAKREKLAKDKPKKKRSASYGTKNKVFTEDKAQAARDAIKAKLGTLNAGIDPELMQAGVTLAGYHIEAGARKFSDFAAAMIEDLGEGITPYLRSFYESVRYYPEFDADGMSEATEVESDYNELKEAQDAERQPESAERDSSDRQDAEPTTGEDLQDGGRGQGRRGAGEAGAPTSGDQQETGEPLDMFGAPATGEPSGEGFRNDKARLSASAAGDTDSPGSLPSSTGGLFADRDTEPTTAEVLQQAPEVAPIARVSGDIDLGNRDQIAQQMPFLTEGQMDDVAFAENRLAKPEGSGVLYTNGTGTGKTFTGLGIISRLKARGKGRILIAAPKQTIAQAWIDAGKDFFDLDISRLENTQDAGDGIVVTTFANLGENHELMQAGWDAFVMDEAHYLASSADGKTTKPLQMLRALSMKRGTARARVESMNQELVKQRNAAWSEAKSARKSDDERRWHEADGYQKKGDELNKELDALIEVEKERMAAIQPADMPRSVFLSATPFAYEKTVKWANEFLFDWGESEGFQGYNQADSYESFMMTHFGYRLRYNKLTEPDAKVDRGLMQRAFNSWLKKEGALSGRALDSKYDYDRKFVMSESALGRRVDEALEWLRSNDEDSEEMIAGKRELDGLLSDSFDYHARMYFLEAMKAREAIPHIQAHLDQGRKVVVMHDFKKGGTINPFVLSPSSKEGKAANAEFLRYFNDLIHSFSYLPSPIDTLSEAFPGALVYNGNFSAKKRIVMQNEFNSDDQNSPRLIIAQGDAMREGVSIHDTTGENQRVMVHLGMPVKPTAAIQQEGRIYRTGQGSDAIFRYFTIGTNWERMAFASKIAGRASAAENLAMGEQARGLKEAFISAYEEADAYPPGFSGEGQGGKEQDRALVESLTPWDMAKSYYFGSKKQGSGRGARGREHSEFFATPEPLGLKMVHWANLRGGDTALEPSAGHGAIGRFFPENTTNRAIEFTNELSSKLALHFDGDVQTGDFMDHNIVNKYDGIVMNPPFGQGGKQAADHVRKAMKHLRNGGRIVALIPTGPAADKQFDKLLDSEDAQNIYTAAEIQLPAVTFERAGTKIRTRVLVLEKQTDADTAAKIQQANRDYSDANSIENFFDRLENSEIPDRVAPRTNANAIADRQEAASDTKPKVDGPGFTTMDSKHSKTGDPLYVVNMEGDMGDNYGEYNSIAKANGGFYIRARMRSYYKPTDGSEMQGKPTFTFKSAGDRAAFLTDVELNGLGSGSARAAEPSGMKLNEINEAIQGLRKDWKAGPEINVVQSISDLPGDMQGELRQEGIDSVAGYWDRGGQKVYLVADGLSSKRDAQVTLLHEAVGHAGIEAVLGREGFGQFTRAVEGARYSDPKIREAYAYVDRVYGNASPITKAAEVVARIAESDPKHNIVQRAFQALRQLLRKLGFNIPFNNMDLTEALRRSRENLRTGKYGHAGGKGGMFQAAYHGSPHRHDGFSTDHIGSGEGQQAYGWGLYFAQRQDIAEHYRDTLSGGEGTVARELIAGLEPFGLNRGLLMSDLFMFASAYVRNSGDYDATMAEVRSMIADNDSLGGTDYGDNMRSVADAIEFGVLRGMQLPKVTSGTLYEVDIPESSELLDWDAAWAAQPESVQKALGKDVRDLHLNTASGENLYIEISRIWGGDRAASLYLKSIGIPGLKYWDEQSRRQAPDVPEFTAWAGYYKGVDLEAASESHMRELRAEYAEFVNAEDTRTHNYVIFDDARIKITDRLFRLQDQGDMFAEEPAAKAAKLSPAEIEEWRKAHKVSQRQGRVPEVQAAAQALDAGEIDSSEYREAVRKFQPIMPIREVPELTSVEDMSAALATNKAEHILGVDREISDGTRVASRLDIPAYDHYDTWVVSIHDGSVKSGKSIAYGAAAVMDSVEFSTNPKAALGVATGKAAKAPFARIHGNWKAMSPEQAHSLAESAMNNSEWTQVGMNPFRHSYFYDKATGEPVVNADQMVQIGPLVMAKNVTKADPESEDFRVKGRDIFFRLPGQGFEHSEETMVDAILRKWQDKMRPLLKAQKDIKAAGGNLNEDNDAYRAEEAFHGKTENDLRKLREDYLEPLASLMARDNITREELDLYLVARHAPERNAQIAKINENMPDGGSGMTDQEAADVLAAFQREGKTEALEHSAGVVYGLLAHQRGIKRELAGDDSVDTWENVYQHYVPLKGLADDEDFPRIGRGFDIRGKESMRAMGRRSMAESPVLHAIKDTTEAHIRKRKNDVGNVFLDMVRDNPDPDYWQIFTDANPDTDRRIVKTAAGDEVRELPISMHLLKDKYFATKVDGQTYYIKLADKRLMRAMQNMGPESMSVVMRGMNMVTRFLSSMSTSYNPEFMVSNASRDIQAAVINLLAEQDLHDGRARGTKLAGKMVKDVPRAIRAIHASLYDKRLTGPSSDWQDAFDQFREDGAKTGWFDMKDIDGQAAELARMVDVAQGGTKGKALAFIQAVEDLVEHANTAVENGVRLSVYKHALEAGVSRKQATSLAKNLTVNFNRKGEIGQVLNSLYMFANASIQGTATFARAIGSFKKDASGKRSMNTAQKLASGLVAGAFMLAMLNRYMSDDDDDGENFYDKVPAHVRERNLVIMKSIFGGAPGEYYTIPLPYGYNVFYNLGDSAEAMVNSKSRGAAELATGLTMALLGSFSPIGFESSDRPEVGAIKSISPTVLSPFVQLAVNENFYGAPIYRENFPFSTPKPDAALTKRSTKEHWKKVSTFLNEATGGSDYRSGAIDISPDTLGHLFDFTTGSAGAFYSRSADYVKKKVDGEPLEDRDVPFYRKVSGKVTPYQDVDDFYKRRDEIGQFGEEYKSLKGDERKAYKDKHGAKLRMILPMKAASKKLSQLRKARKELEASRLSDEKKRVKLERIETQMKSVVDKFNRLYAKSGS